MLAERLWVAALLVTGASPALADGPAGSGVHYVRACTGPGIRCGVLIAAPDAQPAGPAAPALALPIDISNLAPADIQAAYHIDPSLGTGVTIAVVDAYGYAKLESDLAAYRKRFGLPACTTASGCLRIVNEEGLPSPLPAGTDAGWEAETALDVDMVSAACPKCNIVVVQTEAGKLDAGTRAAAAMAVDAISASWGSIENGGELSRETSFQHTGVGTFAASGDNAYDSGGDGPEYPATSQYVIAVGGTKLKKSSLGTSFSETAWTLAGSSCSTSIAAPSYQPAAASGACNMRASSDVSAEADPNTGVAVYESSAGGWLNVGGTSAATPIVAALMAASGHGDITPEFIYRHPEAFHDVTSGNNGTCGTTLCNAGSGWDGPTGIGSPDQTALVAIGGGTGPTIAITSPADGSHQDAGFPIDLTAGAGTVHVDLAVDGVRVRVAGAPFGLTTPLDMTSGTHDFVVSAFDNDHNVQTTSITVDVAAASGGGCSTSGGAGGIGLGLLGVVLVTTRRRRRIFPLGM